MPLIRSIGAVLAGYLLFAVAGGMLFALSGRDPHAAASVGFMAASTLYGMLFAGLGGYLAARLAGRRPLAHAVGLAVVIALGAAISLFTAGGTRWSPLAALLFMAPSATVGGLVRRRLAP